MIVTTDAVVLKGMDYRETSRILTLYTREFGRQTVIAKGARGARPRFGAAAQPLNLVRVVYYRKGHRDLHHLSQCDLLAPWHGLSRDLERMSAGMATVELLAAVTPEEERNPPLFELLVAVLEAAEASTQNSLNTFFLFETRLLDLLGFRPDFSSCAGCGRMLGAEGEGRMTLEVARGGIYCSSCAAAGHGLEQVSPAAAGFLRRMQEVTAFDSVCRITLAPGVRGEVGMVLRRFLQNHVEGLKPLRSESVFAALQ